MSPTFRSLLLFCFLSLGGFTPWAAFAEVRLGKSCVVKFATKAEGIAAITNRDAYTAQFSRFDLQVRLASDAEVTVDDWARFVAGEVEDWTDADVQRITVLLEKIRGKFARHALPLPHEIWFVATSGREESNAAYCRGTAVALPKQMRGQNDLQLETILIHELFHVISNQNPQLQKPLYRILGFTACEPIAIHPSLKDRRITNPDAPNINCVIELVDGNRAFFATPVLYASAPKYNSRDKKNLFGYMEFRLMVVVKKGDSWQAADEAGRAVVVDPKKSRSFHDQIGANTKYIIHPEEILADNFVYLIQERANLPHPKIVEQLQKVLAGN
jgi:hypothetical protein